MKNIILDTNAFIYLTNYERKISNVICIEGKKINDQKFHDYCIQADQLYVTGQSLYELIWQSIEKTNDIHEFAMLYDAIAKYRRIYKVNFAVLNDADGMFDLKRFESQYRNECVDEQYFINEKRIYEAKKLESLIYTLYTSAMGIVVDYCQVDLGMEYYQEIEKLIKIQLEKISDAYYANPGTQNELYDKAIEMLLESVFTISIDLCRETCQKFGIQLPAVKSGEGGSVLIHKLFCKLKQSNSNIMEKYKKFLDEICQGLLKKGEYEESINYLKRICIRSVCNGAKIKKNDGIDFSIVSCLAKDNVQNETQNPFNRDEICAITFDRNLYNFTKEYGVLYNQKIYDDLLSE